MKRKIFAALLPVILSSIAVAQTPVHETATVSVDAPLPPPCEAPTARSPAQPPGPPSPAPAPCRP